MNSSIFIDPNIDLQSKQTIEVIIEFGTKPASLSTGLKNSGRTMDIARQKVDESHSLFREELKELLENNGISYTIMNKYTETFNGVSMKLQSNKINFLLSSKVISAIYSNREQILPIKPVDPMYQL